MNYDKLLLALALVVFTGIARAETTGNELYAQLRSTNAGQTLKAYAYVSGILDAEDFYLTVEIMNSVDPQGGKSKPFQFEHFCFGDKRVTFAQILDIVGKYLEAHPEKRHIRAHSLVRFALLEHFPCANNP